jgi:hypothetical protein
VSARRWFWPVFAALVASLPVRRANATDFWVVRSGGGFARLPESFRWDASLGGAFETQADPGSLGLRLAADAVVSGWISDAPAAGVLGLRPEFAIFVDRDRPKDLRESSTRPYFTLRTNVGFVGWGGATAFALQSVELGPEYEWRRVGRSVWLARVGVFYVTGREDSGDWAWGGAAFALAVSWGKPTIPPVEVPKGECIPLPTRPCPPAN